MLALVLRAAEEDPSRFVLPKSDELIWGSIAFLILFVALAKVAFPAINKILQARAEKIRSGLESAERSKVEADRTLEQYRRQLADARAEAQRIVDEAKKTGEALRADIASRAQREAEEIRQRAQAEAGREREQAFQSLRETVGDLSIRLATKVVEQELADPKAQRALVQRMIDELAAAGNGQKP